MAIEFMKNNDFRNAIISVNEAIKLNPNYDIAWVTKALIYQNLKILDQSEKSYKKAILLNPKSSEILNNYGWFLCSTKNNPHESIKYFNSALDDPTYPTPYIALMNKGICEGKLGDFINAENSMRQANLTSPDWFKEPIKQLAKIKYDQSDFTTAYNFFMDYYKQNNNNLNMDDLLLGYKITKSLNKKKENLIFQNLIKKKSSSYLELKNTIIK